MTERARCGDCGMPVGKCVCVATGSITKDPRAKLGCSKDERFDALALLLGRKIGSTNEVTFSEASALINAFEKEES